MLATFEPRDLRCYGVCNRLSNFFMVELCPAYSPGLPVAGLPFALTGARPALTVTASFWK